MNGRPMVFSIALVAGFVMAGLAASYAAAAEPAGALIEQEVAACKDAKARKDLETRCIETLNKADATPSEKDRACRILKIVGTADCIPALAALLPVAENSHLARFALEAMPLPEAGKALREAVAKTSGKIKVGVINSIGVREDAAAVPEMTPLLKDPDAAIVAAAARAIARAATAKAVAALADFRVKAPKELRPVAADALLIAAEQLTKRGGGAEAAKIYEQLDSQDWPAYIRTAAFAGLVAARPADAAPRLLIALGGDDPVRRGQAAQIVVTLAGSDVTKTFADSLLNLPPEGQKALLRGLANRKDAAARPAVIEATKSADKGVSADAAAALGQLGTASDVPMLAGLAASEDKDLADAAKMSLLVVQGEGVNEALAAAMKGAPAPVRVQILDTLSSRSARACAAVVAAELEDSDATVRAASLKALGNLGGKTEVTAVVKALKAAKGDEQAAARDALLGLCSRARDDALPAILGVMDGADASTKAALLEALGRIGGEKALAAVLAAVAGNDEQAKDEAVRVLSNWPDAAAAPPLLQLAKTSAKQSHQVLGLRGYVRLATLEESAGKKAKMLGEAMPMAKRGDDKRMVLSAWSGIFTVEALKVVAPYLDDPEVKAEAAHAAVAIAAKVGGADKALVVDTMKKAAAATKDAKVRKEAERILATVK